MSAEVVAPLGGANLRIGVIYCATIRTRDVIVARYIRAALFRQRHVIRRRAPSSSQIASSFAETGFGCFDPAFGCCDHELKKVAG